MLTTGARQHRFVIPAADGQKIAWLHAHGEVVAETEAGEDDAGPLTAIDVRLTARELGRFVRL
jgi:GTP-binding protein HflX